MGRVTFKRSCQAPSVSLCYLVSLFRPDICSSLTVQKSIELLPLQFMSKECLFLLLQNWMLLNIAFVRLQPHWLKTTVCCILQRANAGHLHISDLWICNVRSTMETAPSGVCFSGEKHSFNNNKQQNIHKQHNKGPERKLKIISFGVATAHFLFLTFVRQEDYKCGVTARKMSLTGALRSSNGVHWLQWVLDNSTASSCSLVPRLHCFLSYQQRWKKDSDLLLE